MRSTRLTLAVTALSAALALSACSDDGSDDDKETSGAESPAASDAAKASALKCGAAVKVSGAVEASWSGKARPTQTSESGHAIYESRNKLDRLVVHSAAAGEESSVELTVGGTTYTASGDGVQARADGTGAEVTAETSDGDDAGPRVIASFVCYES